MTTGTVVTKWTGQIKQADRASRTISFIASHEQVDADGELVKIRGIDVSRFLRNPILLEQHEWKKTAVAEVTELRPRYVDGALALVGEAHFPDRPRSTEVLADVKAGLLNGISIGFESLKQGPPELADQRGVTHTETRLLEVSLVSLPACPTCLITRKEYAMKLPSCDCDLEITPEQLASAPRIAAEIIAETLGVQRGRGEMEIPDDVFARGMRQLPQLIRDTVSAEIGREVATTLRRLRGRLD